MLVVINSILQHACNLLITPLSALAIIFYHIHISFNYLLY